MTMSTAPAEAKEKWSEHRSSALSTNPAYTRTYRESIESTDFSWVMCLGVWVRSRGHESSKS